MKHKSCNYLYVKTTWLTAKPCKGSGRFSYTINLKNLYFLAKNRLQELFIVNVSSPLRAMAIHDTIVTLSLCSFSFV